MPEIRVLARSSVYETEPVGLTGQPWFLNQVLFIETTLEPYSLLDVLQRVEDLLGRIRAVRWGPRTIDIDLLLYDSQTIASERLTIPHPELSRRRFVLLPLAELDPDARFPDGGSIREMLEALGNSQVVRRIDAARESSS